MQMNLSVLRHRGFRRYFLGAFGAVNGLWIQRVALGWIAWALTGSPAFVGVVAALMLAPTFLSGPIFGVLVDRGNVVRAAFATNGAMLACNALLLCGLGLGVLGPGLLALVVGLVGLAAAANHPVRMSLAPRLVPVEEAGSVVSLAALNFNLARAIAPAIGGWLIDAAGVGAALAAAVLLQLPMLFALRGLRPRAVEVSRGSGGFWGSLREGLAHAATTPVIRRAMLLTGIFALSGRAFLEILPVIADGVFHRGPSGLGELSAAAGAGALAAALMKSLGGRARPGVIPARALVVAVVGLGATATVGLTASWALALVAVAVAGLAGTYLGVTMQALIQTGLADELRGRVMSLWVVVGLGAGSLGALGLGAAAEAVGAGPALVTVALGGLVGVVVLWRRG